MSITTFNEKFDYLPGNLEEVSNWIRFQTTSHAIVSPLKLNLPGFLSGGKSVRMDYTGTVGCNMRLGALAPDSETILDESEFLPDETRYYTFRWMIGSDFGSAQIARNLVLLTHGSVGDQPSFGIHINGTNIGAPNVTGRVHVRMGRTGQEVFVEAGDAIVGSPQQLVLRVTRNNTSGNFESQFIFNPSSATVPGEGDWITGPTRPIESTGGNPIRHDIFLITNQDGGNGAGTKDIYYDEITYGNTWNDVITSDTVTPTPVIILAGQSNALGRAPASSLPGTRQGQLNNTAFWNPNSSKIEFVHAGVNSLGNVGDFGPEVELSYQLSLDENIQNFLIIKRAVGGTALSNATPLTPNGVWSEQETGDLYDSLQTTYDNAIAELVKFGHSPDLLGVCWHQGESDADNTRPDRYNNYETNLTSFVSSIRTDYGTDLPFIIGKIGDPENGQLGQTPGGIYNNMFEIGGPIVRAAQESVASLSPNNYIFSTDTYSMLSDALHYDADGQVQLGLDFYDFISLQNLPEDVLPVIGTWRNPVTISEYSGPFQLIQTGWVKSGILYLQDPGDAIKINKGWAEFGERLVYLIEE